MSTCPALIACSPCWFLFVVSRSISWALSLFLSSSPDPIELLLWTPFSLSPVLLDCCPDRPFSLPLSKHSFIKLMKLIVKRQYSSYISHILFCSIITNCSSSLIIKFVQFLQYHPRASVHWSDFFDFRLFIIETKLNRNSRIKSDPNSRIIGTIKKLIENNWLTKLYAQADKAIL